MYDCFYFIFALSQLLLILNPKLNVCSCLGKTSCFSYHGFLLFHVNPPPVRGTVPSISAGHKASCLCGCTNRQPSVSCLQSAVFEFVEFHHFPTCKCFFFLNPGISFCADTYPRSNLHETILLRQAFCALLNDGCLREMVIMIDFEP